MERKSMINGVVNGAVNGAILYLDNKTNYGILELKKENKLLRPIVKATDFQIEYKSACEAIF